MAFRARFAPPAVNDEGFVDGGPSDEQVSLKGNIKTVDRGDAGDGEDSQWSLFWAAVGWWFAVVVSVPFAIYAGVFVYGEFSMYQQISVAWVVGPRDKAGLNVLHHLRAWQIHSLAAEAFLLTAPFQFMPKFRKVYPERHRLLGYVFVSATAILIISGLVSLLPHTDFGTLGSVTFFIAACFEAVFLTLAVKAAKERRFKQHQRFMIRTAANGYAVVMVRYLPQLIHFLTGISIFWSFEVAPVVSHVLFYSLAEIYIQNFLK